MLLGFICLIIPGIILSFAYTMVFYVFIDNPGLNAKQISEKLHLQYSRITLDVVKNSLKRKLVQYVEFRGSPKTGGYFVI